MTDQLTDYPLPDVRQLFPDPGDTHVAMLEVVDGVLAELTAQGITVDPADFLLRSHAAWQVWKQYCPQP